MPYGEQSTQFLVCLTCLVTRFTKQTNGKLNGELHVVYVLTPFLLGGVQPFTPPLITRFDIISWWSFLFCPFLLYFCCIYYIRCNGAIYELFDFIDVDGHCTCESNT